MITSPVHILPYPFPETQRLPYQPMQGHARPAPDFVPAERNCWDPRTWGVKIGGSEVNLIPGDGSSVRH